MQLSDQELVQRMKCGDKQAFECLYDRYYKGIHKHLSGIVRHSDPVDDLVQEVFLQVWHKIEQWKGTGSFKAWLYKIATNQALYYLRSRKTTRTESLHAQIGAQEESEESFLLSDMLRDETFPDPETVYTHKTTKEYLHQHISNLSPEKQEIIRLIYDEDFSIAKASETLKIPEGTVKSRLHYAIKQLSGNMRSLME